MNRSLEPEILDSLPAGHPDALHNRRDLRLTNQMLGNHRWIARTLPRHVRPGEPILELGAGTGELGRLLAGRGLAINGLDLWPRPAGWPAGCEWHRADLRGFTEYHRYPIVVGNLIFHQFSPDELGHLGQKLRASARAIIACEPARRRLSQVLYRALAPFFGANYVSLHDAHVSIAAGFRGRELADALGLTTATWRIHCSTTWRGLYRLVAVRLPA